MLDPSQRSLCLLIVDTSQSMSEIILPSGRSGIEEINFTLKKLQKEFSDVDIASEGLQLAIVCTGGPSDKVGLLLDWMDVLYFQAPQLIAGGHKNLGLALRFALTCIERQKSHLKSNGIGYSRPRIMLISEGKPMDDQAIWESVIKEVCAEVQAKRCEIFPVGISDPKLNALELIFPTRATKLTNISLEICSNFLNAKFEINEALADADPWQIASI